MQLTKFTDYSLRVMLYLARHPERLATIAEISEAYDIPSTHLTKVVHRLGLRGYIVTVRGNRGGMRLARNPDMINIGDLIRDTEDNMDIAECFASGKQTCPMLPACALKSVLNEARKSFLSTLDGYHLSDIIGSVAELPSSVASRKAHVAVLSAIPRQKTRKTAS